MEELSITINIADRQYRLKISDKKEEDTIRKAVEEIKRLIKEYADNFAYKDKQDLLAMVTLQQTLGSLESKKELKELQKKMDKKLEGINKMLSNSVDDL